MKKLIEYTNNRINQYYYNCKKDYNIIGSGTTSFKNNQIIIDYTEQGIKKQWSMFFHEDYLKTHKINWVFDCWSESYE